MKQRYSRWNFSDTELDTVLDALYAYQSLERGMRPGVAERADRLRKRLLSQFVAAAWAAEADEWVQDPLPEST